jgi:hypothetical protein
MTIALTGLTGRSLTGNSATHLFGTQLAVATGSTLWIPYLFIRDTTRSSL